MVDPEGNHAEAHENSRVRSPPWRSVELCSYFAVAGLVGDALNHGCSSHPVDRLRRKNRKQSAYKPDRANVRRNELHQGFEPSSAPPVARMKRRALNIPKPTAKRISSVSPIRSGAKSFGMP